MANKDEIEKLKRNWVRDPIWDLETTEGFEEHHDELLAFRQEKEAEWKKLRLEDIQARSKELGVSAEIAEFLHSFKDIESDLDLDAQVGDCGSARDYAQFIIQRAQAQATLLLAAQVKRVADVLEANVNGENWFYVSPDRV